MAEVDTQANRTLPVTIRDERSRDIDIISDVTQAAFASLAISQHTEQFIVDALRAAKALTISLVAEMSGDVVGHIAFSPVQLSDGSPRWYGLGPVSVHPDFQRKGIGSALIVQGLGRLQALGANGCCLVGHPGYYTRFGFRNVSGLGIQGVPPEFFFALSFNDKLPSGTVMFHDAFKATSPVQRQPAS